MDAYFYEATTKEGNIVTGTIEAENENKAVGRLQDMGYFPLKVNKNKERKALFSAFTKAQVKERDIMTYTYQLGVLLDAGFPLDRSLFILADLAEKESLRDLIKELLSLIRSGKSFSEALSRFPSAFPIFYVNMIKAGEAGGFLEDTISRMAVYLENSQALKEDIRSALIYPAILSVVGGGIVVMLLTFVVPKFSGIFTDLGDTLPLPTVILLAISKGLTKFWWLILLLILGSAIFLRRYFKSDDGRRFWDRLKFRLPLFGKLYREAAVSRFARTLGTLLGSGVPILNALEIVKGTIGSGQIADIIASVREGVRRGRGISEPLKKNNIFPPLAVHMITVGEETGKLDEMLLKIADRFDLEVKITIKRMLSFLEPVLILFMGILVGFIVISMLLAIFSINELPF